MSRAKAGSDALEETAEDLIGDSKQGLSEDEAARRLDERGPIEQPATSRSMASIIRANVFTLFNLILVSFGVLTFIFGHFEDALFIAILVGNAGIGILQEWRAKRALDRLAALVAPHATVVRDGFERQVGVDEVVVGDLVQVAQGDQLVADGEVDQSHGLRLDESNLTGETRAVHRRRGEEPGRAPLCSRAGAPTSSLRWAPTATRRGSPTWHASSVIHARRSSST